MLASAADCSRFFRLQSRKEPVGQQGPLGKRGKDRNKKKKKKIVEEDRKVGRKEAAALGLTRPASPGPEKSGRGSSWSP